jgi:pimeloyl-ACP methyl ester carboxylesterase
MEDHVLQTEFGDLYTAISRPSDAKSNTPALLLLHGQGFSSRVFGPLIEHSPSLTKSHSVIVFDYPGHGRSTNAPDPSQANYHYGYACAAVKVLQHYQVTDVIVLGWSVGGHVALELISALAAASVPIDIHGIMICGTPPVPKQQISGFKKDGADVSALFSPDATDEDLSKVADTLIQTRPVPQFIIDDLQRLDHRAGRSMIVKHMEGSSSDQVELLHQFKGKWVAVVNGADEPMLDLDSVEETCKGALRLWRGECVRLKGQGHAPMFDDPAGFAKLFGEFVADCS